MQAADDPLLHELGAKLPEGAIELAGPLGASDGLEVAASRRFIGVFVLIGLVAILVSNDSRHPQVAIVSPDDNARLEAGRIAVRIRVQEIEVAAWQLSLKGPHTAGEWMTLARGSSVPQYSALGAGIHFIELAQPGEYELHLEVTGSAGILIEDFTHFRIEE